MTERRRPAATGIVTAGACAVLLLGAACGGTPAPAGSSGAARDAARSPATRAQRLAEEARAEEEGGRPGRKPGNPPGSSAPPQAGAAASPTSDAAPAPGPGRVRTAPARAVAWDPPDDADSHGDVPDYTDITRAEVIGGDAATLSVVLTGGVPPATEDNDTFATIGFRLRPPRGPEAYVYADGDSEGWTAYVQRGETRARLATSALAIRGRTLSLRVPWRALGNPGSFDWYADLAWVRGTLLDTHYALDSAPTNYWESFRR